MLCATGREKGCACASVREMENEMACLGCRAISVVAVSYCVLFNVHSVVGLVVTLLVMSNAT